MAALDEYIFDDDGNPVLNCPNFPKEESLFEDDEDCKDIFHIKGDGYDVLLSLCRGIISWTNVNPSKYSVVHLLSHLQIVCFEGICTTR